MGIYPVHQSNLVLIDWMQYADSFCLMVLASAGCETWDGLSLMGLLMGSEGELVNNSPVPGREFSRIRGMKQDLAK